MANRGDSSHRLDVSDADISESEPDLFSDPEYEELTSDTALGQIRGGEDDIVSDTSEVEGELGGGDQDILPDLIEEEAVGSNVIRPEWNAGSGPSGPPGNPSIDSYVRRCTLLACITSALLGLGVGVSSETMSAIRKEQRTSDEHEERTIFGLHVVGLVGAIVMGIVSDGIGRRYTIILIGAIFSFGHLLMALSSNNFVVLLGRTFSQIGVGYTVTLAPIYISEMCPAGSRGFYASLPQVFVNTGSFLGCIINYLIYKSKLRGWPLMLGEGVISTVLLAVATIAMPESPQWLVLKGNEDDARIILARTSNSSETEVQINKIKEAAGSGKLKDLIWPADRSVRHIVICAICMQIFLQACGVDALLLYSPQIFKKVGIVLSKDKVLLTAGLELVKAASTLVAAYLLDREWFGRRRLLLGGIAGITVSLFTLGMSFAELDQTENNDTWARACIASLFVCGASFYVGVAPVTSTYIAEIFPLTLRGRGCAIAFAANQLASGGMAFAFSWLHETFTLSGTVNVFAVVAFVVGVIFYIIIPETRGRTLEEMALFFGSLTRWDAVARNIDRERSTQRQVQMQPRDRGHGN